MTNDTIKQGDVVKLKSVQLDKAIEMRVKSVGDSNVTVVCSDGTTEMEMSVPQMWLAKVEMTDEQYRAEMDVALRNLGEAITTYFNTPSEVRTIQEILRRMDEFRKVFWR